MSTLPSRSPPVCRLITNMKLRLRQTRIFWSVHIPTDISCSAVAQMFILTHPIPSLFVSFVVEATIPQRNILIHPKSSSNSLTMSHHFPILLISLLIYKSYNPALLFSILTKFLSSIYFNTLISYFLSKPCPALATTPPFILIVIIPCASGTPCMVKLLYIYSV